MKLENQILENTEEIENLLEEVLEDLSSITEENFNQKFLSAKYKMEHLRQEKSKNRLKNKVFEPSKKIIQLAKLISEKYDNVIKDWADRLKMVQKEMELTQNRKKITIYNR